MYGVGLWPINKFLSFLIAGIGRLFGFDKLFCNFDTVPNQ